MNIGVGHYHAAMISGAERSIADVTAKLNDQHKFFMVTPGAGALADFYRQHGFEVLPIRVETPRRRYPGLHQYHSRKFAKLLIERGIDVFLCNTFSAASRYLTSCQIAKVPCGLYIREYIKNKRIYKKILDRGDLIIAISSDIKQHVSNLVDPQKVVVIYNHIDKRPILDRVSKHRNNSRRKLPYPEENPVVGLVGRITKYKRPDIFIRAIPNVISKIPDAKFVVIGTSSQREKEYELSLRKLVSELKIENSVSFMGHREDAIELMSELSISCLTSNREPLGRVILESQIIGVPVVVSDRGGQAEIVKDGSTGLLFSITGPNPEIALADKILRLLCEAGLSDELSKNARESVEGTLAGENPIIDLDRILYRLAQPDL